MTRGVLVVALSVMLLGCSYGPKPDRRTDFVLFFTGSSTDLDAAATSILVRAVNAALIAPNLDITVAGYEDAPTTPESSQIVSRIRAQMVADNLVQRGVPRGRIQLVPRHAIGADPGTESTRVEIRIGS